MLRCPFCSSTWRLQTTPEADDGVLREHYAEHILEARVRADRAEAEVERLREVVERFVQKWQGRRDGIIEYEVAHFRAALTKEG